MENSGNEKVSNFAKDEIELRIKRYQLWTAIVVLVAAIIPTVTTFTKINEVLRSISRLAEKPLEGEWDYESKYVKYYDEVDPHMLQGTGKAVVIWKNLDKRYEINISYGIIRSGQEKPLLASFLHGYLDANEDGWPAPKDFRVDRLSILNRVHYRGTPPTLKTYHFRDCNYFKKRVDDEHAQSIECIFETPISKSHVTLKLNKALH